MSRIAVASVRVACTDEGGRAVRKYAGEDDLGVARAQGPLGLDVVSFSNADHRRAHDAGHLGDEHYAYRQHGVDQARAEYAHDYDSQKDAREGQEYVHEPHENGIGVAAEVASEQPDDGAGDRRDGHGGEPCCQRDPGAVDHAREDVAAELVLPEGMREARPRELALEVLGQGIVGRDERREDCHQDEDAYDDEPEEREPVGEEGSPEVLPAAAGLNVSRCRLLRLAGPASLPSL